MTRVTFWGERTRSSATTPEGGTGATQATANRRNGGYETIQGAVNFWLFAGKGTFEALRAARLGSMGDISLNRAKSSGLHERSVKPCGGT